MTQEKEIARLAKLLRILGVEEPEDCARSEVIEDIPQLTYYLFLRQAWARVVPDGDISWIDRHIEESRRLPDAPCSGIGPALERLQAAGADSTDITEVVRVMQYELLFALCYLLEDPCDVAEFA